jgi:RNA recognition motif-containing protein
VSCKDARSDPSVLLQEDGGRSDQIEKGTTTFMLRNIPNRLTAADLIKKISCLGFQENFDFFYMPLDLQSKQNKGYAFINLLDDEIAAKFLNCVNGTQIEGRLSSKEIHVCTAAAQGLLENLCRITHTNWSKKEHMPLVRVDGHLMHMTPLAACEMLRIQEKYA